MPRPLLSMAFILVQIMLPFASPFVVGTQATSAAYSTKPPSVPQHSVVGTPKTIRPAAGVSLQVAATTTIDSERRSIRKFFSSINPFSTSGESWKGGEYNATLPSQLLFRYSSPLVDLASERQLNEDDAFLVPEKQKMGSAVPRLTRIYDKCRSKARKNIAKRHAQEDSTDTFQSLILAKALLLHQRKILIYTGFLRLLNTAVQAFPALLLARLLRLVEAGDKNPPTKALQAALTLVAVLSLKMILENQYFHNVVKGATEVRGALSGVIFEKSLRLPGGGGGGSVSTSKETNQDGSKQSLGAGGVLNLMQSDASMLESAVMQLHTIWDGPLQVKFFCQRLLL